MLAIAEPGSTSVSTISCSVYIPTVTSPTALPHTGIMPGFKLASEQISKLMPSRHSPHRPRPHHSQRTPPFSRRQSLPSDYFIMHHSYAKPVNSAPPSSRVTLPVSSNPQSSPVSRTTSSLKRPLPDDFHVPRLHHLKSQHAPTSQRPESLRRSLPLDFELLPNHKTQPRVSEERKPTKSSDVRHSNFIDEKTRKAIAKKWVETFKKKSERRSPAKVTPVVKDTVLPWNSSAITLEHHTSQTFPSPVTQRRQWVASLDPFLQMCSSQQQKDGANFHHDALLDLTSSADVEDTAPERRTELLAKKSSYPALSTSAGTPMKSPVKKPNYKHLPLKKRFITNFQSASTKSPSTPTLPRMPAMSSKKPTSHPEGGAILKKASSKSSPMPALPSMPVLPPRRKTSRPDDADWISKSCHKSRKNLRWEVEGTNRTSRAREPIARVSAEVQIVIQMEEILTGFMKSRRNSTVVHIQESRQPKFLNFARLCYITAVRTTGGVKLRKTSASRAPIRLDREWMMS